MHGATILIQGRNPPVYSETKLIRPSKRDNCGAYDFQLAEDAIGLFVVSMERMRSLPARFALRLLSIS